VRCGPTFGRYVAAGAVGALVGILMHAWIAGLLWAR